MAAQRKFSICTTGTLLPIAFVAAGGALVRLVLALKLPFWGDECATVMFVCRSYRYILTRFEMWLTMNVFIALEKVVAELFGDGLLAMRAVPLAAGIASIVVMYYLAKRLLPAMPAYLPVVLFAFNPSMIYYSAMARSYSILILLSLLLMLCYLRWREQPSRGAAWVLGSIASLMLLFHMTGIFIIAWLGVAIGADVLRTVLRPGCSRVTFRHVRQTAAALFVCLLPPALHYALLWEQIQRHNALCYDQIAYGIVRQLPETFSVFFGAMPAALTVLFGCLFCIGCIRSCMHDRFVFFLLAAWVALPLVITRIIGFSYEPQVFARYIIYVLPVVILLISYGLDGLASCVHTRARARILPVCAVGMACACFFGLSQQFQRAVDFPYHTVATHIHNRMQENDVVLINGPLLFLQLIPYFECSERSVLLDGSPRRLQVSLASHLQAYAGHGRLFLVLLDESPPDFGAPVEFFGRICIVSLPEESRNDRIARLIDGFERNIARKADIHNGCANRYYGLLADLHAVTGDTEQELLYREFVSQCAQLQMEDHYRQRGIKPE